MKIVPLRHAAEVVLGRQRAPEYENGDGQTQYLRSANIRDGRVDLSDVKSMRFSRAERLRFRLRPGDVLVTEGSGSRDTVGASAVWMGELEDPICFQNTLLRLRPRAGVEGRYLAWWTRHAHASGLVAAVATGANIQHVGADALGALTVAVPKLEEQRRVADFLDDQVVRLEESSRRAAELLLLADERVEALLAEHIAPALAVGSPLLPVARLLRKLSRPPLGSEMVTAFRDGQVIARSVRRSDGFTNSWTDGATTQGVRIGDVVIHGLDGFAGAIGTSESEGVVSPANHVCLPLMGDSDFYGRLLRVLALGGYLSSYGGSARERAVDYRNWTKFSQIRLPVVPHHDQCEIGDLIRMCRPLRIEVERLQQLVEERKRALITACVTGEFDVSAASGRAGDAAYVR